MRIGIHNKPPVSPYEYWCFVCRTMNLAFVELDKCPECGEVIKLKGEIGALDVEELRGRRKINIDQKAILQTILTAILTEQENAIINEYYPSTLDKVSTE